MYYQRIKILGFLFASLCVGHVSFAQTWDTTFLLKEVEIVDNRLSDYSVGQKTEKISGKEMQQFETENLGDLLNTQSGLFIKTYGSGSLATPSFRGTSASHTAILWNGINLQSNMNGQYDLSLNPVFLMDEVLLQHGGGSALFGSGAVGGSIHMNAKPAFSSGLKIDILSRYASFNNWFNAFGISFGSKRSYTKLRLLHHTAENDFPYKNVAAFGHPLKNMTNAQYDQKSLLVDQYFLLGKNQSIEVHSWFQDVWKQIPPSMTMSLSKSFQEDDNIRLMAAWKRYAKTNRQSVRLAYLDENIAYTDSLVSIFANNNSKSIVGEFENNIKWGEKHQLKTGIHALHKMAKVSDYSVNPKQFHLSAFVSYAYRSANKRFQLSSSLREELVDFAPTPLVPSIGIDYRLFRSLKLKTFLSRVYRNPSFNDLYWSPGGNPDLKAENGWSNDIGLSWEHSMRSSGISADINVFNNVIDDWIVWLPDQFNIWSPENIRKVWARGLESSVSYSLEKKQKKLEITPAYSFTRSTNQEVSSQNNALLGRQLMYVPMHQYSLKAAFTYKNYWISMVSKGVGRVYVNSDNTSSLKPYYLLNLSIGGKPIVRNGWSARFTFHVKNLLNKQYQAIEWHPMPGRNYSASIHVYLKTKKEKK
jgi:vitamin B12 transporter